MPLPLLTVPQAADESGIPYQTLLRLIREKQLPAVEIPGRRSKLVDMDDVHRFIDERKTGSFPGAINHVEHTQVALNEQSQKNQKTGSKAAKYDWMHEYTRK